MQHILFSLLSAIIGLNFIVAEAQLEKGQTPVLAHYNFKDIPQRETKNKEENPADAFTLISQISPIPSLDVTPTISSKEKKSEAYNQNSSKVIGSISEKSVEHSKALLPCTDPNANCNPTSTPSATLIPTHTITPTPTVYLTLSITPTLIPEPTLPHPIDPPPCDPRFELPVKENTIERIPCIY